jgi:hypothetical protein
MTRRSDSLLSKVRMRRYAHRLSERSFEMSRSNAGDLGESAERDGVGDIVVDVLNDPAQPKPV